MKAKIRMTPARTVALCYFLILFIGTVLLCLPVASADGVPTGFIDALFTATSAVCITGLAVVDTALHWSLFGEIVILLLIQLGGLGFMTIVTLLSRLFGRQVSIRERRLFMMNAGKENIGGVFILLRNIIAVTAIFELAGTLLLMLRFIPEYGAARGIWYSIFTSVSAFCNAGFDLMGHTTPNSSLTAYAADPLVNITVMVLIIIGGLGFVVWSEIKRHGVHLHAYSLHAKIVLIMTAVLLTLGTVCFFFTESNASFAGMDTGERMLAASFMSVTARTAGFSTVDMAATGGATQLMFVLLMVIGGAPGSTAGGLKVTTAAVLLAAAFSSARRNRQVVILRRQVDEETVGRSAATLVFYLILTVSASLALCIAQPLGANEVFFECVSAASNTGVSLGITPSLGIVGKLALTLLMYGGRVGILSLMLVIAEKRRNLSVMRPGEEILVG